MAVKNTKILCMVVFLDYDGTLVPIEDSPEKAKIPRSKKEFLKKIARNCIVSIVTGRDMKSFSEVFGDVPNDLFVITSHGYRIYKGDNMIWTLGGCEIPDIAHFEKEIKRYRGALLESKDMGFAVHYRNLSEEDAKSLIVVVDKFLSVNPPVKVIRGKKVIEAIYCKADKGTGVSKLLELIGYGGEEEVIYFGDDTTDLDGMREVKRIGGRTYFVGEHKPKEADHIVSDPEKVYELLIRLCMTSR